MVGCSLPLEMLEGNPVHDEVDEEVGVPIRVEHEYVTVTLG